MTNRAAENLTLLATESERLIATADQLGEAELREPSLCAGWSRAHVLTHLARNADALVNLVRWAADGRERPAYPSETVRAAEVELGAGRSRTDIMSDLVASEERFRAEAEVLTGPAGEAVVRSRVGTPVTGAQVVAMRLLEVVFHHVDLRAGYTFDDADPPWVARTLQRGVRQWADPGVGLTLLPAGLDPLELGGGGAQVRGTPGSLLLWLARGDASGLHSEVALPRPPAWS